MASKSLHVICFLLSLFAISLTSTVTSYAANTCTSISSVTSVNCAGEDLDITIAPDPTDGTRVTFSIHEPTIANSKYCLAFDYSLPSPEASDIHIDSTGNTELTKILTLGPHRVAFFITNDSSQFTDDSFRCSVEKTFTVTSTIPATPTPTPNRGDPECIVGVCCDLSRQTEITNKCQPNSYCDVSQPGEACSGMSEIGTIRSGALPTKQPQQNLWERFSGTVTGVQCPANQTYIAIFDACLDFASTLSWTMTWALIIASLLALVRFAIGAIQLVFSTGDPSKLQNGRKSLTDAILGLVLLSIAWIVFGYLNSTLPPEWQINLLTLFG
ncbi:hypothetical protein COY32_01470 [candidate division WWE3 bacterium CG_4_10_14_0_2_um_filter_41_14]|uniref:Ig-like domain-containing protein n=1 Tax=candidate division WWE3 bacterium CG_4_10_14_0_2_um_filter_41_14 TaxID=1975072 RepID=A0A2M7TKZ1_UNCKA|nr:MAG: hypothetical protein COY32_01470 [candidate division WWE3 bacterium CG_4_10_14_0_2_um_filter_41_14]